MTSYHPKQVLRYARVPRAALRMTGSLALVKKRGGKDVLLTTRARRSRELKRQPCGVSPRRWIIRYDPPRESFHASSGAGSSHVAGDWLHPVRSLRRKHLAPGSPLPAARNGRGRLASA